MESTLEEYSSILPKEVLDGIASRSKWLSKQFPQLQYDDLVHDGIVEILTLLTKTPEASSAYIMKAVNNIYSSIMEDAIIERDRFVQVSDMDELADTTPAPQEEIDFQVAVGSGDSSTRDKREMLIIAMLKEGKTLREVVEITGMSRSTVYNVAK